MFRLALLLLSFYGWHNTIQAQVDLTLTEGCICTYNLDQTTLNSLKEDISGANSLLRVYLQESADNPTAILGRYSINENELCFKPLIAFSAQLVYEAQYQDLVKLQFSPEAIKDRKPTIVKNVFPSSDTLPANLLKLYLHFSAPIAEGNIYRHIHLINELGDTLANTFLQLEPELWNKDRTRLTLWLEPGRIKRDLGPNIQRGAPLEAGQTYRLYISAKLQDAQGYSLAESFQKFFVVASADRVNPSTSEWQMDPPAAGTKKPLSIFFGECLDHAVALKAFSVSGPGKRTIPGQVRLYHEEKYLHFYPNENWLTGSYQIKIDARLEDLAGNNLNRLFDRNLFQSQQVALDQEFHFLDFQIK